MVLIYSLSFPGRRERLYTEMQRLTVSDLKAGDHVIALFDGEEDHDLFIMTFISEGLKKNEKVIYLCYHTCEEKIKNLLSFAQIHASSFLKTGQLEILHAKDFYLKDNRFDTERTLRFVQERLEKNLQKGYSAVRITGEMSWILENKPGTENLLDYERQVSKCFSDHKSFAVCQYPLKEFGHCSLMLDLLSAHPQILYCDDLFQSAFFDPTDNDLVQKNKMVFDYCLYTLRNQKILQEKLFQHNHIYKEIIMNFPGVLYQFSQGEGTLVQFHFVSETSKRYWGINSETLLKGTDSPFERVSDCSGPSLKETLQESAKLEELWDKTLKITLPDGQTGWYRFLAVPYRQQSGKVVWNGLCLDVTLLKTLEHNLRRERDTAQKYLDLAGVMFMVLNKNLEIILINPKGCDILDEEKSRLMGRPFLKDYIYETDREPLAILFKKILSGALALEPDKRFEMMIRSPKGGKKILSWYYSLLKEENDSERKILISAEDITEKRFLEEKNMEQQQQLMEASKMVALGTLVTGVAHEINNPNNFITLNTPLLEEIWQSCVPILEAYFKKNGDFSLGGLPYKEMKSQVPKLFSGILLGAERIKKIVDNFKNFARHKKTNLNENVDLNEVVKASVTLIEAHIHKSTRDFSIKLSPEIPSIRGDFYRLEQVTVNLLQNACQSLPNPKKGIEVSTFFNPQEERVILQIKDEGMGIPRDILPRIKDPFFTTRREAGGTGLGLSISSAIVEEHGGFLHFHSEPGQGTIVTVSLPSHKETLY